MSISALTALLVLAMLLLGVRKWKRGREVVSEEDVKRAAVRDSKIYIEKL